jgi:hypothetical protein
MRPGYGYPGVPDAHAAERAPKDSGVFRIDLESGQQKLIVSLADIAQIPYPHADLSEKKHWFNHLLVSPDGKRVEFLNRCRKPEEKGHVTRMFTAAPDGSDVRIVDQCGVTSHFIWRDPQHILAWSLYRKPGGFFLFEDRTGGQVELVLPKNDGHCTYLPLPGNEWILCDTYPDRERNQNVYLYHIPTQRQIFLGHFHTPKEYTGEWRCDTHPRFSPNGHFVTVDSPSSGQGRQIHLIDIRGIVGASK